MIIISDDTLARLQEAARRRGVEVNRYLEDLLVEARSNSENSNGHAASKPHRAMQFSASAPSGRTATEIAAEIDSARDEWDKS